MGLSVGNMAEFDFGDCGTVMLNEQDISHATPFRTTGWVITRKEGFVSFKGNETHIETVKGPHKVLIDGKLAPNVAAFKAILKRYEVINKVSCHAFGGESNSNIVLQGIPWMII